MLSMARVAVGLAAAILGCAFLTAASGCAAPEHTYVANTANRTYFKVPASWHEIDQTAFEQPASAASPSPHSNGEWIVAYDAAQVPSPAHLFASNTLDPIVYVSVLPLPTEANGQVSLDNLRDLMLPVTADARAAAKAASTSFSDFILVSDSELTPTSGLRGIHEVFQYRVDGGLLQTFDQTAYTNKEGSKVYLMLLRCSSTCYQARHAELESVTTSFTIQERP
jgi:hypothetical protein